MPRPLRAFVEGIYHVSSGGSDTRYLFLNPKDRMTFLDRLALVVERFRLGLVSYVLLGNHYHMLVATPGREISSALQQLHGWYSLVHNRRHGRSAHLFRAHCFARRIRNDADLLVACRYLARNPVEAGLCADPYGWRWSSAAATAGLVPSAIPLDTDPLRAALGGGDRWRRRYREFIEAGGERRVTLAG